jgi:hypothetical protein
MNPFTSWVAVVLAISPFAQDLAPSEADLRGKSDAIAKTYVEKSAELVHWAYEQNLYREAAGVARCVLAKQPDHEVAKLLSQIEAIPQETFLSKYRDARRASGVSFQTKLTALDHSTADGLVAIARDAEKAKFESLAESLYFDACRIDSTNASANAALRKRDYDVIFNHGPIPKVEKEHARKSLSKLGGGFLGERDLKTELGFWSDAWGMSTTHYRIVTNVDSSKAFRFAQDCEDLYASWGQLMKDLGLQVREWKEHASVYLFDSGLTYQAVLRTANVDPPKTVEALGFYWGETKVGYFYDDVTAYRGDVGMLAETLCHEGGHQLFDLRFKTPSAEDDSNAPCPWLDEGLAMYLETLVVEDKGKNRVGRFGSVLDDDLAKIVESEASGGLAKLSTILDTSQEELDEPGTAQAGALVHFLLHGSGGAYRKAFSHVIDTVHKSGTTRVPLYQALGMKDAQELQAKFLAHIRGVLGKLPRRKYGA